MKSHKTLIITALIIVFLSFNKTKYVTAQVEASNTGPSETFDCKGLGTGNIVKCMSQNQIPCFDENDCK